MWGKSTPAPQEHILESHYLISRLTSSITISHSRYRPWVQLLFEHIGLSYLNLFFENCEFFSVRWAWQLRALTTNCTSPTPTRCVEATFQKLNMVTGQGIYKNLWSVSSMHYASFCENEIPHNWCSKCSVLFCKLSVAPTTCGVKFVERFLVTFAVRCHCRSLPLSRKKNNRSIARTFKQDLWRAPTSSCRA